MKSRATEPPEVRTTRATQLSRLVLVLPFVAFLMALGTPSAGANTLTLCQPTAGEMSCVNGTVGSRAEPVGDADVTLTRPDGTEETVTTGDNGRFSFEAPVVGEYLLSLDGLPEGLEQIPPEAQFAGPDGTVMVNVDALGRQYVPALTVRSVDYDSSGTSKADQLLQAGVNGLRLGLLLALASLGLSLIYGTTGLSNFAHAELVTLGGMVAYGLVNLGGLNLWLGIVLTTVICGLVGYTQDRVLWQPLRRRGLGLTQMMIVTIGLALAAQYSFQYFVGASTQKVVVRTFDSFTVGPVRLSYMDVIAMLIALVLIIGVGLVLVKTRIGQATRAVSDNPALASASGIDVDKIIRIVWTSAGALAGLAGVLYALTISNGIRWDTGMQILLLLFAAVTLGGLGTAFGAMLGSLIIGVVVELSGPLGAPGDLKYAVALLILIVLLLFRPQGLLGRPERIG